MKETINLTELVKKAANGDNKAFEELYRATVSNAFRTANLILSNPNDAEDVLQNAYIKAAEKLSELKKPESFENWLKTIIENECKNYIRKEKRISAPFVSLKNKTEEAVKEAVESVPQEIMEREDLKNGVMEIVNSLSPETRACIVLFHYEDKSLNEIAEILNISVGTVKSRLHNGRKKIENQFNKLRKKDPTLYGVAAIPFLLSFLVYRSGSIALPASLSSASAGITVAATATAASTTTATAASAATATAASTATVTAAATSVAVKAAAVVVAGSLTVGGTAAIKNHIEKISEQAAVYSTTAEETGAIKPSEYYVSEEASTESKITQIPTKDYTVSSDFSSTTLTVNNIMPTASETSVRQESVTSTQKPSETATSGTTQRPTETAIPATNPENSYSVTKGIVTKYTGGDSKVTIPGSIGGNTVTAIGAGAFQGNAKITSVSLPATVTQIGQEAFADCASLSSVAFPSSLGQIGIGAFYGCSSLRSVTIPDSVTVIGDEAFANCTSLKTVTIPSSVTDIADDAFYGCDSLTIVCSEGSAAHNFAIENSINYTF